MSKYFKNNVHLQILAAFFGMPLLIWAAGTFPQRTWLKESLSVVTMLAFSLIIGLFYLSRTNAVAVKKINLSKLLKLHKIIGYTAVAVLILHPFLLVVPRFFEAGVAPIDAFITIVTTVTSRGVVFGLIAWCLMLTIGITSLVRKKLPLKYRTWRVIHGILASLCIASAACHVIDLGRHSNLAMSVFIAFLTTGGVLLLLKNYTVEKHKQGEAYENR